MHGPRQATLHGFWLGPGEDLNLNHVVTKGAVVPMGCVAAPSLVFQAHSWRSSYGCTQQGLAAGLA